LIVVILCADIEQRRENNEKTFFEIGASGCLVETREVRD
jgi:hypothetical protein